MSEGWAIVTFVGFVVGALLLARWLYAVWRSWQQKHKPVAERIETVLEDARQVQLSVDDLVCGRRNHA